jgi:hypothetical protein
MAPVPRAPHRRQLIGKGRRPLAVDAEHVHCPLEREEEGAAEHDRADRVETELEARGDAEVAAAATQSPEQFLVLECARRHSLSVCGDDIGGDEVANS